MGRKYLEYTSSLLGYPCLCITATIWTGSLLPCCHVKPEVSVSRVMKLYIFFSAVTSRALRFLVWRSCSSFGGSFQRDYPPPTTACYVNLWSFFPALVRSSSTQCLVFSFDGCSGGPGFPHRPVWIVFGLAATACLVSAFSSLFF